MAKELRPWMDRHPISAWNCKNLRHLRAFHTTALQLLGESMTSVILPIMKTAVSIPDRVFQSAEKLATRLGVSRSQLYANALASLVEKHREDLITSQLNEVYGPSDEESSLAREVGLLQSRSISRAKW